MAGLGDNQAETRSLSVRPFEGGCNRLKMENVHVEMRWERFERYVDHIVKDDVQLYIMYTPYFVLELKQKTAAEGNVPLGI